RLRRSLLFPYPPLSRPHLHAGARRSGPQIAFLLVHIGTDPRTREAADPGPDDLFGAIVPPADEIAEQIAAERAADAADRGLRYPNRKSTRLNSSHVKIS